VPQWLRHALTALPIAAMVAGIAFIGVQQDASSTRSGRARHRAADRRLPPDAYTDPGFIQFLQSNPSTPAH
jgi:hypothetical protein